MSRRARTALRLCLRWMGNNPEWGMLIAALLLAAPYLFNL